MPRVLVRSTNPATPKLLRHDWVQKAESKQVLAALTATEGLLFCTPHDHLFTEALSISDMFDKFSTFRCLNGSVEKEHSGVFMY